jgi:hypothetical protein
VPELRLLILKCLLSLVNIVRSVHCRVTYVRNRRIIHLRRETWLLRVVSTMILRPFLLRHLRWLKFLRGLHNFWTAYCRYIGAGRITIDTEIGILVIYSLIFSLNHILPMLKKIINKSVLLGIFIAVNGISYIFGLTLQLLLNILTLWVICELIWYVKLRLFFRLLMIHDVICGILIYLSNWVDFLEWFRGVHSRLLLVIMKDRIQSNFHVSRSLWFLVWLLGFICFFHNIYDRWLLLILIVRLFKLLSLLKKVTVRI